MFPKMVSASQNRELSKQEEDCLKSVWYCLYTTRENHLK